MQVSSCSAQRQSCSLSLTSPCMYSSSRSSAPTLVSSHRIPSLVFSSVRLCCMRNEATHCSMILKHSPSAPCRSSEARADSSKKRTPFTSLCSSLNPAYEEHVDLSHELGTDFWVLGWHDFLRDAGTGGTAPWQELSDISAALDTRSVSPLRGRLLAKARSFQGCGTAHSCQAARLARQAGTGARAAQIATVPPSAKLPHTMMDVAMMTLPGSLHENGTAQANVIHRYGSGHIT
jgi:hypothetical protein